MIVTPSKEIYASHKPYRITLSNRIKHQTRLARRRFSGNKALQASLYDGALASKPSQHRVVLYFAWGEITLAKQTALTNLAASGLDVFVIVNRKSSEDYRAYLPYARMVMDRPNWGYDFGGWKDGVQQFDLSGYNFIYFVNDSIIGPWAPVTEHLDAFEQSEAEVFGVTDSAEWMHHIQSYFFGLSAELYHSAILQRFWGRFKFINNNKYVIHFGEMMLSKLLSDREWYIVAPRAELDNKYSQNCNKLLERFDSILGDGKHNKRNKKGTISRYNTTMTYYEALIKDYNLPIFKARLISTFPHQIDEFVELIQDHP